MVAPIGSTAGTGPMGEVPSSYILSMDAIELVTSLYFPKMDLNRQMA
jgi:hypothetical protein